MPVESPPPRLHFLVAARAPIVIVLARVRSKWFHVMRWNTAADELEPGSWFRGRIYGERCDVSFDGEWMAYFAAGGAGSNTWTGVCRAPWLATL